MSDLKVAMSGCKWRFSCASVLTYLMYAPLRCSEIHHFRLDLTLFDSDIEEFTGQTNRGLQQ